MTDEHRADQRRRVQLWYGEALRLATSGQHRAAVLLFDEVVADLRVRAIGDPQEFCPLLARALCRQATSQHALGHATRARDGLVEAVAALRKLAKDRPETFLPDLAHALVDLASAEQAALHLEEALAAATEGVALFRALVRTKPAVYLPDLARALHTLANQQTAFGSDDEALATTIDAMTVHRALADANPAAWRPALARSLNALAIRQSDLGLRAEAIETAEAAVGIATALVADAHGTRDAGPVRAELGRMLNNLANRQAELGLVHAALDSARQAVSQLRGLVGAGGAAWVPELATALQTLAGRERALGRAEQGVAHLEEAVAHWQTLLREAPDTARLPLAVALRGLAQGRAALGRFDVARDAAREATTCLAPLVERHRPRFAAEAAHTLYVRAEIETRRGDADAVIACASAGAALVEDLLDTHGSTLAPITLRLLTLALEAAARSGTPMPEALLAFALQFHERRAERTQPSGSGLDLGGSQPF